MINGKRIAALCTSRIYEEQHNHFINVLSDRLSREGIGLLIFAVNTDFYWEENNGHPDAAVYDIIPFDKIDALLFMDERIKSHAVAKKVLERAGKHSVPAAVIDGDYDGVSSLRFDYDGGFEEMVRHVIGYHGCRRPHFMAGIKGNKFSESRFERFKKVIEEYGITYDDSMLSYGEFWAFPARQAAEQLLNRSELPDAVICANDIMAINVCDVFAKNGVDVPSQVIVTGFDGIPETSFVRPEISTVLCDNSAIADDAADVLISLMNGGSVGKVLAHPKLMPNASCGCEKKDIRAVVNGMNENFYRYQDDVRLLYDITVRMQMSRTSADAAGVLKYQNEHNHKPLIHDFCCIADRNCLDRKQNYFDSEQVSLADSEKVVICDSFSDKTGIYPLDDVLIPNISDRLSSGFPLIFNALDYCGKALGYVCYAFGSSDPVDYSRTPSITQTLSMGLGGHMNMLYQRYLSDKVRDMYKFDSLTRLYNRAGFNYEFSLMKEELSEKGGEITVIMSDLDGLKRINDSYGHDAGDKAISLAASALKKACPNNALCMRYGGDELIAVIAGRCEADSIMRHIESIISEQQTDFDVSVSCGAHTVKFDRDFDLEAAVKQADRKMYAVKRGKRRT